MIRSLIRTSSVVFALMAVCLAQSTMADGLRLKREQRLAEAAAAFREVLRSEPENVDALVQLATVEGWQKHYSESIRLWEQALARRPNDADIGIGLARVLYWKGENLVAHATLNRVLDENPRYLDALVLMGDIEMARGRHAEAHVYYLRAHKVDPEAAGLTEKIASAVPPLKWRLDAGFAGDNYSNFRHIEHTAFEQLSYRAHPRATVWLRHDHFNHFKQVDNTVGFGGTVRVSRPLFVTTDVSITPKHDFEPQWKFYLGADYVIHSRVTLSGSYRRWTYDAGVVNMFAPGIRWQALSWLGALLRYNVSRNLDDAITGALQGQMDFQVHEQVQLYGGFARGEENIPPQARAFFKVYSGGVVWNPHRRLGLRLDYSFEGRRGFYDRHSVGPGIRLSF